MSCCKRRQLRIQLLQIVIQPRKSGAEIVAIATEPFGEGGERRIQIDRIDLVQHVGQRLKQRIDFELDVLGLDVGARSQLPAGLLRRHELDRLRTENRCARDTHRCVSRNVAQLVASYRQRQLRLITGVLNVFHLADLDAAVFDLGVLLHHQARPRGGHRHCLGIGERGGVGQVGENGGCQQDRS